MIKTLKKYQFLTSASALPIALLVANFASFAFNAFLGRVLTFSDFGVITLLSSLWYLLSIPINALGGTLTHRVAYLSGKDGQSGSDSFFIYFSKLIFVPVLILSVIWILLSPLLAQFFNVTTLLPIFLFSPAIYFGTYSIINRSYIQGRLLFLLVSATIIIENVSKLIFAILFISTGRHELTYLSIPISIFLAYAAATLFVRGQSVKKVVRGGHTFPKSFFTANILSNVATTAFITVDVILVKHFFDQTIAGQYALLSLIGKMIYFFGTLFNGVLFTHVSKSEGAKESSTHVFNIILAIASLATFCMFVVLGPLGHITTPVLFGDKIQSIEPYLTLYALGLSLFTVSNIISVYYLAKQKFIFSAVGIISAVLLALGITLFHTNLFQITYVILIISLLSLLFTIGLHIMNTRKR